MRILATHLVDAVMAEEKNEPAEEKPEATATEDTLSLGVVNMFNCILITQTSTTNKQPKSDGPS